MTHTMNLPTHDVTMIDKIIRDTDTTTNGITYYLDERWKRGMEITRNDDLMRMEFRII